jgi:toxin-antitoxin system PIN domain toxin
MQVPDVNVLVFAFDPRSVDHERYRSWLHGIVNGDETFGIVDSVLSSVIRVVTNPRIFNPPSSIERALGFTNQLRGAPNAALVTPGARHWDIFVRLCHEANVRGDLVPDAYLAALAIESGNELVSADRDFSRFPGLRWRHPLQ